jgi:hypothetical protein
VRGGRGGRRRVRDVAGRGGGCGRAGWALEAWVASATCQQHASLRHAISVELGGLSASAEALLPLPAPTLIKAASEPLAGGAGGGEAAAGLAEVLEARKRELQQASRLGIRPPPGAGLRLLVVVRTAEMGPPKPPLKVAPAGAAAAVPKAAQGPPGTPGAAGGLGAKSLPGLVVPSVSLSPTAARVGELLCARFAGQPKQWAGSDLLMGSAGG